MGKSYETIERWCDNAKRLPALYDNFFAELRRSNAKDNGHIRVIFSGEQDENNNLAPKKVMNEISSVAETIEGVRARSKNLKSSEEFAIFEDSMEKLKDSIESKSRIMATLQKEISESTDPKEISEKIQLLEHTKTALENQLNKVDEKLTAIEGELDDIKNTFQSTVSNSGVRAELESSLKDRDAYHQSPLQSAKNKLDQASGWLQSKPLRDKAEKLVGALSEFQQNKNSDAFHTMDSELRYSVDEDFAEIKNHKKTLDDYSTQLGVMSAVVKGSIASGKEKIESITREKEAEKAQVALATADLENSLKEIENMESIELPKEKQPQSPQPTVSFSKDNHEKQKKAKKLEQFQKLDEKLSSLLDRKNYLRQHMESLNEDDKQLNARESKISSKNIESIRKSLRSEMESVEKDIKKVSKERSKLLKEIDRSHLANPYRSSSSESQGAKENASSHALEKIKDLRADVAGEKSYKNPLVAPRASPIIQESKSVVAEKPSPAEDLKLESEVPTPAEGLELESEASTPAEGLELEREAPKKEARTQSEAPTKARQNSFARVAQDLKSRQTSGPTVPSPTADETRDEKKQGKPPRYSLLAKSRQYLEDARKKAEANSYTPAGSSSVKPSADGKENSPTETRPSPAPTNRR